MRSVCHGSIFLYFEICSLINKLFFYAYIKNMEWFSYDNKPIHNELVKQNHWLFELLADEWMKVSDYYKFVSQLQFLKNKIDFVDLNHTYLIKRWLRIIIPFLEEEWLTYTIDKYWYFMIIDHPDWSQFPVYSINYWLITWTQERMLDDKVITWNYLKDNNYVTTGMSYNYNIFKSSRPKFIHFNWRRIFYLPGKTEIKSFLLVLLFSLICTLK